MKKMLLIISILFLLITPIFAVDSNRSEKRCNQLGCEETSKEKNQLPLLFYVYPTPANNSTISGIQYIRVRANDPDGKINRILIYFGNNENYLTSVKVCDFSIGCSWKWDTTQYSDGQYYVEINARDDNQEWNMYSSSHKRTFFVKN